MKDLGLSKFMLRANRSSKLAGYQNIFFSFPVNAVIFVKLLLTKMKAQGFHRFVWKMFSINQIEIAKIWHTM